MALWSAATGRRLVRLADSSAKERRAERREKALQPTARHGIVCPTTFDGEKPPAKSGENSPHSKGFAPSLAAPLFKQTFSYPAFDLSL